MATQAEIDQAMADMKAALAAETDQEKLIYTMLDTNTGLLDQLVAQAGSTGTVNVADITAVSDALKAQRDELAAAALRDLRPVPPTP